MHGYISNIYMILQDGVGLQYEGFCLGTVETDCYCWCFSQEMA